MNKLKDYEIYYNETNANIAEWIDLYENMCIYRIKNEIHRN